MGSSLQRTMDLWLCLLYFLPVSGSLKILPEVQLDGEWGGSIIIKCPLPQMHVRMYLCRQMTDPRICTTVVSNNFVKKEYESRVILKPCLDEKLFLVEMTQLTESDNGVYACGVGVHTDRGKTQKITLIVHNEYEPFWEDEPTSEPPRWFHRFLPKIPKWLRVVEHTSSSEFISEVTKPAPRTETPPAQQPSSIAPVTGHPRVSGASSVTAAKSPARLPATTLSKTLAQQAVAPQGASYSHHTRLYGQRTPHHDPQYGREEDRRLHIPVPEFHILIPTFLGFLLLVLLGMMVKRAVQRRKAFSRRAGRLAMRMRSREASRPFPAQRLGAPQRPRSQNNVYSACPRRARGPDSVGPADAPLLGAPASTSPAQPQQLKKLYREFYISPVMVENLVNHVVPSLQAGEPFFVPAFLYTYREFATTEQVLDMLLKRYSSFRPHCEEDEQVKNTFCTFLGMWIDKNPEEFCQTSDLSILKKLKTYLIVNMPYSDLLVLVMTELQRKEASESGSNDEEDSDSDLEVC